MVVSVPGLALMGVCMSLAMGWSLPVARVYMTPPRCIASVPRNFIRKSGVSLSCRLGCQMIRQSPLLGTCMKQQKGNKCFFTDVVWQPHLQKQPDLDRVEEERFLLDNGLGHLVAGSRVGEEGGLVKKSGAARLSIGGADIVLVVDVAVPHEIFAAGIKQTESTIIL
jgi:hypothetical protein